MSLGISVVLMTNEYARSRQGYGRNLRIPRRFFFDAFSSREPVPTSLENALSGTDHRNRDRIEVPPGVQDRLGTKAAHTDNEDHVLERFHVTASTLRGPTSR